MLKQVARAVLPVAVRRFLQRRKLERHVADYQRRVVQHRYGAVTLRVELADPLAQGWYDRDWPELPELVVLGRHRLMPGARVFDLGAHQGVVGLMLAHRVGPDGHVVLVEPIEHNLGQCRRNAELNGVTWITTHKAAVADRDGTIEFNRSLNGQAGELCDYCGLETVAAVTVDTLTMVYGPPDVVFVDVEGFECRALAGAERTFAAQPDWFVEVHVGHGLEAAGGSAQRVLQYFPAEVFERYVHAEGDSESTLLEDAPPEILRSRFFLTAVVRDRQGVGK
jgi:FkbM family methyltransferase